MCPPALQIVEYFASGRASRLDQELVPIAVPHLGEGEVVPAPAGRSSLHRDAKAGASGLAAVDRHEKAAIPADGVGAVDMAGVQEHAVLDGDGGQLAGPDADEGANRRLVGRRHEANRPVRLLDREERAVRREQIRLPRMWSHDVAEQRIVVAGHQAVTGSVLLVGPADRQVRRRADLVVHDRLVADGWTDRDITPGAERR